MTHRMNEVTTEARKLCLTAMVTSRGLAGIRCTPVQVEPTDPRTGPIPWVAPGSVASRLPRNGRVGPDVALVLLKTSGSTRGTVLCRAVSPATLPNRPGEPLHVAPTAIHERQLDDSVRATAHLFQHQPPGTHDARLLVLDGQVLPAADVSSLPTAPGEVTRGAVRTVTRLGLRFAELRFAVGTDGTWTFLSCDPSPDLWELDEATGFQAALAVAHALTCSLADGDAFQPDGTAASCAAPGPQ